MVTEACDFGGPTPLYGGCAAHSVNCEVSTEPVHGKEGWSLTSYQWDEHTGVATYQYTRNTGERREVTRHQPTWQAPPVKRQSTWDSLRGPRQWGGKRGAR